MFYDPCDIPVISYIYDYTYVTKMGRIMFHRYLETHAANQLFNIIISIIGILKITNQLIGY